MSALNYSDLLGYWRRGFRNGNWRGLSMVEKAFYRASMWFARVHGWIVSARVVGQLVGIVEKLKSTIGKRILRSGLVRSKEMCTHYEGRGIFRWLPRLREWLIDPDYVFWLGLTQVSRLRSSRFKAWTRRCSR